ncbi:hypothetical protein ACTXT7_001962 [Hymenolepis weldensis]
MKTNKSMLFFAIRDFIIYNFDIQQTYNGHEVTKPIIKSSSHEDESLGLKRTSSAQSTLTEAARMLATMPGYDVERLQTHCENDQDPPDQILSPSHPFS